MDSTHTNPGHRRSQDEPFLAPECSPGRFLKTFWFMESTRATPGHCRAQTNPSELDQSAAQAGLTKLSNLWTVHTQLHSENFLVYGPSFQNNF